MNDQKSPPFMVVRFMAIRTLFFLKYCLQIHQTKIQICEAAHAKCIVKAPNTPGSGPFWREAGHFQRPKSPRTELMWQPKGSGIGSIG